MGGQTNNPTNCSKCTLLEQPNLSLVWDSSVSTRKDIQQVSVSALMHMFTEIKWKKKSKMLLSWSFRHQKIIFN